MASPEVVEGLTRTFGGASGAFERLLALLALDPREPATMMRVERDIAVMSAKSGFVALLRWGGSPEQLAKMLAEVIPFHQKRALEIVVFGGPDVEVAAVLKKATPSFQTNAIESYHFRESGPPVRSGGAELFPSTLWKKISEVAAGSAPAPDWTRIAEKIEADAAIAQKELDDSRALESVLRRTTPVITFVLLALIALMFGLELWFGGSRTVPTLSRLGGLIPTRVVELGEVWRLWSAAFLHAGLHHLVMNAGALYVLGAWTERLIGSRRFVVLYALSALGGGIATATLRSGVVSVGASGAIWGLLAAQVVLVFRSRGLLPRGLAAAAKKEMLINLAINGAISLLPMVDVSAHFGGGVVGAALVLSGVITRGLPPLAEVREGAKDRPPRWMLPAAVVCSVGMLVCVGVAVARGRVWELLSPLEMVRVEPVRLGEVTFEVPRIVSEVPAPEPSTRAWFGDVTIDPLVVRVRRTQYPARIAESAVPALIEQWRGELAAPIEDWTLKISVAPREVGGRWMTSVTHRLDDKRVMERTAVVDHDVVWMVEVDIVTLVHDRYGAGIADRIAESIRRNEVR